MTGNPIGPDHWPGSDTDDDSFDARLLSVVLRTNFPSFIHRAFITLNPGTTFLSNWHIDLMAYQLERCRGGEINRLILNLPPRGLKSHCASVCFPAFLLGHDPTTRIICVSYSNDLAAKHARDFRSVITSDWYRRLFPWTQISSEKNTEFEVVTTELGSRLATSVGGTLTGRGGNYIIIDDPHKPDEALSDVRREGVNQWFDNSVPSRLDDKMRGCIIIVTHRVHNDDLVGHVLEQGGWDLVSLPAIAEVPQRLQIGPNRYIERAPGEVLHPEHEPLEVLERDKESMGTYNFSCQYLQSPIPIGGAMIDLEWFEVYDRLPAKGPNDWVIQSWDTASKADERHDYTVCITCLEHDGRFYIIYVLRERLEFPELKRRIVNEALRYNADVVLIEDRGSGTQLIQELQNEKMVWPIGIEPKGDKATRMLSETPKIEAGRVLLPERAPWLLEFEKEILQFPHSSYDDQVDSLSQLLAWVSKRQPPIQAW